LDQDAGPCDFSVHDFKQKLTELSSKLDQ